MKNNVLIPIDFTVKSLLQLKKALQENNEKCNYFLVKSHELSDSISDLLFFSRSSLLRSYSTPEFNEALEILKNKYPEKIQAIHFELFTGLTLHSFESLVEARGITSIYCDSSMLDKASRFAAELKNSKIQLNTSSTNGIVNSQVFNHLLSGQ
jgi:hypothetical protein